MQEYIGCTTRQWLHIIAMLSFFFMRYCCFHGVRYDDHPPPHDGAKTCKFVNLEEWCKMSIYLPRIGVDTIENELPKVSMTWGSRTGAAPVMVSWQAFVWEVCDRVRSSPVGRSNGASSLAEARRASPFQTFFIPRSTVIWSGLSCFPFQETPCEAPAVHDLARCVITCTF